MKWPQDGPGPPWTGCSSATVAVTPSAAECVPDIVTELMEALAGDAASDTGSGSGAPQDQPPRDRMRSPPRAHC
jgi:hypothetical protein